LQIALNTLGRGKASSMAQRFALGNLGNLARLRGDYERALEYYQKALALSEELSDRRTLVISRLSIGVTLDASGRVSEGRESLRQALEFALPLGDKNVIRLAHLFLAKSYQAGDDVEEMEVAYRHYRESIELLETARASLSDVESRSNFFGTELRVNAYRRIVAVCVRQQKLVEAFDYAERGKARTLLEILATADVSDVRVEPLSFAETRDLIRSP
jgi:tetratricopeptide (TPR) repeat protein